jgi:hypothetical protein
MPKTRIDMPNKDFGPCLLTIHVDVGESDVDFEFHAIALFNVPISGLSNAVYWCAGGTPTGWPEYPNPSPQQLALAQILIDNPPFICDTCRWCHSLRPKPFAIRWGLTDGENYPWRIPACPWDGTWLPFHWTPDQWPPTPAYF